MLPWARVTGRAGVVESHLGQPPPWPVEDMGQPHRGQEGPSLGIWDAAPQRGAARRPSPAAASSGPDCSSPFYPFTYFNLLAF